MIPHSYLNLCQLLHSGCAAHVQDARDMLGVDWLLLVSLTSGTLQVHEILGEIV